jgi:hypothetical protein
LSNWEKALGECLYYSIFGTDLTRRIIRTIQQSHLIFANLNLEEVIGMPITFQAFGFDAGFYGMYLLQEIERHMPQDCKILQSIIYSKSALVFLEGNIHDPV